VFHRQEIKRKAYIDRSLYFLLPYPAHLGIIDHDQRSNLDPKVLDSQRSVLLRLHHLRPPPRTGSSTITDSKNSIGVHLYLGGGLSLDGRREGL
jgi:hypothetical protein